MDSMRSLNTSLPRAGKSANASRPDVLMPSFKAAAMAVTHLYKQAQAETEKLRVDGYQEALEDLIGFLDRENLGVGDGEGWRIRQWAMEKLDGALPGPPNSDSDEEAIEEKRARSSSPVMDRNPSSEEIRSSEPPHADTTARSDSAPPPHQMDTSPTDTEMVPAQGMFHFSSPVAYPPNHNTHETSSMDLQAASRRAFPTPRRSSNRSSRNLQRAAASNLFSLGTGAGHKRKLMQDFFNIDNINDRRDGPGGGSKRGRNS
ncbi:hypothetical protein K491DRAFT_658807 [Lophiostoma macrostomum CBS 122681]|uniref:Uncharacterized protein n=1 Tax=Lophiostoma macrostomum CBS 122681 TaxID=1314788 RepID=A0A6A6T7D6_9PLEO|nr:hypothetical protein K491DRAFT_658807 [Lophiostoma macrostomum CBS 122681]